MFDLTARRQINRGFTDGFTRAVEIVLTPLLMGFFGYLVDRALGTGRAFTIVLGVLGAVGIVVKLWIGYDRAMRVEEAKLPSVRPAAPGGPVATDAPREVEP